MRPIDGDKYKDILERMAEHLDEMGAPERAEVARTAAKGLNTMPTLDVELPEPPRWIPVEECLPETIACGPAGTAYSEAVIVWTSGRKAMIAVWDGEIFLCAADYWEAWDEKITHWMPLPTPPKESTAHG